MEGDKSDKIHLIKRGECALYKLIEKKDEVGQVKMVQHKLMDLGYGELFGEDMLCFNVTNTYSIRVESTSATLLSIDRIEFVKKYKRIV